MGIILTLLLQGASQQAERHAKSAFLAWKKESMPCKATPAARRTVTELRALAKDAEKLRLQREAKQRAQQDTRQRKRREAYLLTLASDFDRCWNSIDQYAERGTASGYDEANRAIVDLADAYVLAADRRAFDAALQRFMERHGKRSALVRRLVNAGLWQK